MNYLGWAPRLSYSIEQVNIASPRECPPLLLPNPILLDNMRSSFWCRQLIGGGKGQGSHRKGHRWSWKALPAPLRPIWWALHPQGPRVFFGSRRRAQQLGWSVSTCCLVEFWPTKGSSWRERRWTCRGMGRWLESDVWGAKGYRAFRVENWKVWHGKKGLGIRPKREPEDSV